MKDKLKTKTSGDCDDDKDDVVVDNDAIDNECIDPDLIYN
jgi:hypothetical protein